MTDKKWEKDWNRIKSHKLTDRTHENEVKNIIDNIDFDCFIDCGVGYVGSEAWSVRDLKPNCLIFGFEPQNSRYKLLEDNDYPGTLIKKVVSNKIGMIEGFMGYENGGKSDFWLHGGDSVEENAYKKANVLSTTIDKIIDEFNLHNKKIFIWGDIEGSELLMLEGTKKALENGLIEGLLLELRDYREAPNHCVAQEVIEFLNNFNIKSLVPRKINRTHKDFLFKKI